MFVKANVKQDRSTPYDITTRKQGTDAYHHMARGLIKAAEKLAVLAGAHVKFQVLPTWPRRQKFEMQLRDSQKQKPGNKNQLRFLMQIIWLNCLNHKKLQWLVPTWIWRWSPCQAPATSNLALWVPTSARFPIFPVPVLLIWQTWVWGY